MQHTRSILTQLGSLRHFHNIQPIAELSLLRTFSAALHLARQQPQASNDASWSHQPSSSVVERPMPAQRSRPFTYVGPLSKPIRNLKRLSLISCAASFAGAPLLVWHTAQHMPLAAQVTLAATLCGFGTFTTGLLHWFTGPYVHRLYYDPTTHQASATTLSILARPQTTCFRPGEVAPPQTLRPQVTFQVKGRFFYLDPDNFSDKALLAALTPAETQSEDHITPHSTK